MAWQLHSLIQHTREVQCQNPSVSSAWVPCRPVPPMGLMGMRRRIRDAWLVLRGKADAVIWPQGQ